VRCHNSASSHILAADAGIDQRAPVIGVGRIVALAESGQRGLDFGGLRHRVAAGFELVAHQPLLHHAFGRGAAARRAQSGDCPFRNAVTRISRSMSLEVITLLPTVTAMRSMMAAEASVAAIAREARRAGGAARNWSFLVKTSVLSKRKTGNG
jgi:hypothetical protein